MKNNKSIKYNLNAQNGSITLFVLISIMFFVIVLMGIFISSSNKIQTQQKDIEKIQQEYNKQNAEYMYEKAYQSQFN